MRMQRFLHSIPGRWFAAVCGYGLMVAPFGCQFQTLLNDNGDPLGAGGTGGDTEVLGTATTGMFIADDADDSLLIAGRSPAGESYFVHGLRDLARIDSILLRDQDGGESFIAFDSGWPVHVEAADGSYAHITYQEVSQERLTAEVELLNAADGFNETYLVDVDLQQAAEQVAELVRSVTGQDIETPADVDDAAKDGGRGQRITIFSPLFAIFVLPLVAIVTLTVVVLGQIVAAIYQVVAVTIHNVALIIFSPLFIIGGLINNTVTRVRIVPLSEVFDRLPPPPVIRL
jgi:hypothetical protein